MKHNTNPSVMISSVEDYNLWDETPITKNEILDSLNVKQQNFERFKDLWYQQYLLGLRDTFKDLHQINWENRIKINDIVLIKLMNKPRPYWVLGRVLKLIYGHDDKIRIVKLKRGDGQVCFHSLKHLYPIELSITHNSKFSGNCVDENIEISGNESGPSANARIPDVDNDARSDQSVHENLESSSIVDCNELKLSDSEGSVHSVDLDVDTRNGDGSRSKRRAAVACKHKLREWSQVLKH